MSKIYEALLRAEQDRTASGGKEPAWESALNTAPQTVVEDNRESWPQSGAAPTDDTPTDIVPTDSLSVEEPIRAHSRAEDIATPERPATQRRANDLDLSTIAVTPWSPAIIQLPALSHARVSRPQHPQVHPRQQRPSPGGQELYRRQPRHLLRSSQGEPRAADRWRHAPFFAASSARLPQRARTGRVPRRHRDDRRNHASRQIPRARAAAAPRHRFAHLHRRRQRLRQGRRPLRQLPLRRTY